ncbi:MAG: DUF393 domain-containing protein [Bacteroidia bacterium]|nr:DUF393 domain-containing protein [Bacteroidia bacterium]NNC84470.1 DUF393 domain-containing protein [Bacteroidia bacterium]
MNTSEQKAIIFYDGECGFCNDWVLYVIKHDNNNYFQFCSLHSETAKDYAKKYNFSIENKNSIALLENGIVSRKSLAAQNIAIHLDTPFNWATFLKLFPRPIADFGYNIISKLRHQLSSSSCEIRPELQEKFIA